MTRRSLARLGLVALGYVAAYFAGVAAVWWKNRGISEADQLASSGMFAFGDSVQFISVAALVAVVPTVLLFHLAGAAPRFWRIYSSAALLLAGTGSVAAALLLSPVGAQYASLQSARALSVLRVLAGPVFFLAFVPGLLPAASPYRRRSLAACLLEVGTMASFGVYLVIHAR